jgi:hypothetical protein
LKVKLFHKFFNECGSNYFSIKYLDKTKTKKSNFDKSIKSVFEPCQKNLESWIKKAKKITCTKNSKMVKLLSGDYCHGTPWDIYLKI